MLQPQVPASVQRKARAMGEEGVQWLAGLGGRLEALAQRWQFRPGNGLAGGSEAYVAEAHLADGTVAILKLYMPPMEGNTVMEREIDVLSIADGRGYAKLLDYDREERAVLLERLGLPLLAADYTPEKQMRIMCEALKESWDMPLPREHQLQSAAGAIGWFREFLPGAWTELARPCPERVIGAALELLHSRSASIGTAQAVLVHGDVHNGNVLQDPARPQRAYKLIDPDGLVAEPAYDLGVLMREWPDEWESEPLMNGRRRCRFLAGLTGADPRAIWEWGIIQAVATGLLLLRIGEPEAGRRLLHAADVWSAAGLTEA